MKTGQAVIDAAEIVFPQSSVDMMASGVAAAEVAPFDTTEAAWIIGNYTRFVAGFDWRSPDSLMVLMIANFASGYFWAHAVIERGRTEEGEDGA